MRPATRRGLLGALLGLPLGAAGPARPRTVLAAVPIARLDLPWWRERHAAKLAELRRGPVELVFLGDSITQDWEKPEYQPAWLHRRCHLAFAVAAAQR
jgi:hypothetical protein